MEQPCGCNNSAFRVTCQYCNAEYCALHGRCDCFSPIEHRAMNDLALEFSEIEIDKETFVSVLDDEEPNNNTFNFPLFFDDEEKNVASPTTMPDSVPLAKNEETSAPVKDLVVACFKKRSEKTEAPQKAKTSRATKITSRTLAWRIGKEYGLAAESLAEWFFRICNNRHPDNGTNLAQHEHHAAIVEAYEHGVMLMPDDFVSYEPDELERLASAGQALGLDFRTLVDFLFVGSRKKKRRQPEVLLSQMINWTQVIKLRGFPFKFKDKTLFVEFSKFTIELVGSIGLPCDRIQIKGSSLRSAVAKDVDVAIMVHCEVYAGLLRKKFSDKKIKEIDEIDEIKEKDITKYDYKAFEILAAQLERIVVEPKSNAKIFLTLIRAGLMRSDWLYMKNENGPLLQVEKKIQAEYEILNIEHLIVAVTGGAFDLEPSLTLSLGE
jgi:hypothetical protein